MTTQEIFAEARRLYKERDPERALDLLRQVPAAHPWSAEELVLKARLVVIGDEKGWFTFEDIVSFLSRAHLLDRSNPVPLIEMGYLRSRVLNEATTGLESFQQAISLCTRHLAEAIEGLLEARDIDPKSPEYGAALVLIMADVQKGVQEAIRRSNESDLPE